MAVYKRSYKAYAGPLTNPSWRFLVIQRYAFRSLFRSRALLTGYTACFILPLMAICTLYINQNASVLALVRQRPGFITVSATWFMNVLTAQGIFAGLLTAFVGPTLVAPDLSNGALPMYLSRPFTRAEYILGKGLVLGVLIGSITLLPGLAMFAVQSSLAGIAWFWDNLFIAGALTASSAALAFVLILIGLAMSAWVRWKIVAGALVLAVFAIGKGFGAVINQAMRTNGGYYLDVQHLLGATAAALFRNSAPDEPVSVFGAWLALIAFCALLLALINRKLRVCEVAG